MIVATIVTVISISLPGYIISDTYTTGEQHRPWATNEYKETSYTDSPLIEWTILQKTTDVFETSATDDNHTTTNEQSETTAHRNEYDYVTSDDLTSGSPREEFVTNDVTGHVTSDVTHDVSDLRISDVTRDVSDHIMGDVTRDVSDHMMGDVTRDVSDNMMGDVTRDFSDHIMRDVTHDVSGHTSDVTRDVSDHMMSDVTRDVSDHMGSDVMYDETPNTFDTVNDGETTVPWSENTVNLHTSDNPGTGDTDEWSKWTLEDSTDLTTNPTESVREYFSTTLHKFSDDCVYDISRSTGEIIFPDNDHLPRANSSEVLTCKWRIRTEDGPNIRLHFRKLELELGSEYLELAVGMGGNKATRFITGTKLPADIVVEGSELWLTLKSRQKDGFTQLSLTYEETADNSTFPVTDNTTCGGLLVDLEGNITSPNYPDQYTTNEECTWFVAAPAHSVIQMTIVDFKTEVYDQVRIGVGLLAKAPASRLLTLFGELVHERETIVPANSLWINFYSDDTITSSGFFIKYKMIPRDICSTSNVFESESGVITSVNYPNPYPINSECTWTILGHPGSHINMTFHDLRIQDGRDFVLVGQGKEVFDGPFTTYTGNISRSFTLTVKASNAWLHFTSDHLVGDEGFTGFNLTYLVFERQEHTAVTPHPTPSDVLDEEDLEVDHVPKKDVLIFRLRGVQKENFESRLGEFRTELARIVNERCQKSGSCRETGGLLRTEDVEIESLTSEGEQLVVEVVVGTALSGDYAMDSLDYDELEKLFHSDLQTLDLQHGPGEDGVDGTKLPEWLIGVIVVVILLIAVFFAMVIYSLVKERKKQRAGSYGGNTSSASMCDEVEVGKEDGNIRITSFIVDNEKANGNGWVDTEASTLQRRPQTGIHGCMNPAFVDEDEQAKPKSEKKKEHKTKVNEKDTKDQKEKSVEEESIQNKNDEGDTKTKNDEPKAETESANIEETATTVETHEVEVNETDATSADIDTQSQKESTSDPSDPSDPSTTETAALPDLSTNL